MDPRSMQLHSQCIEGITTPHDPAPHASSTLFSKCSHTFNIQTLKYHFCMLKEFLIQQTGINSCDRGTILMMQFNAKQSR